VRGEASVEKQAGRKIVPLGESMAPGSVIAGAADLSMIFSNELSSVKKSLRGHAVSPSCNRILCFSGATMDFGPWEQIFYGEFDGKRKKRILIKIIGE
jgi:hypothetical protein